MKTFADFEVWIGAPTQGETIRFPVQVIISPAGLASGEMVLDSAAADLQQNLVQVTGVTGGDPGLELRKSFGKRLFDALFKDSVRDVWKLSLGRVDQGLADVLRLRLLINPPDIAVLPWELLWAGDFLATASDVVISRYLPVPEPPHLAAQKPLRILLVVERPEGLPTIEQSEVDKLQAAISNIGPTVQLKTLQNPTVSDIQDGLQQDFHVLHFLGHGTAGKLALVEDDRRTQHLIGDNEFAQLFLGRRSLRLIVLNACNSAQAGAEGLFSGVGPVLVQKRIPAVVAMQYSFVQIDTASQFSQRFYSAIGNGLPVDVAVNEARQLISAGDLLGGRDWSTPVLYMGTRSGQILNFIDTKTAEVDEAWQSVRAAAKNDGHAYAALKDLSKELKVLANYHKELGDQIATEKRLREVATDFERCLDIVGPQGVVSAQQLADLKIAWEHVHTHALSSLHIEFGEAPPVPNWYDTLLLARSAVDDDLERMALLALTNDLRDFGRKLAAAQAAVSTQTDQTVVDILALSNRTLGRLDVE